MNRKLHNILITGGAGFIGSNFIHYLFGMGCDEEYSKDCNFSGKVINIDCLTYAGNLENLADVEKAFGGSRYFFHKVNICDRKALVKIFETYNIDTVINFAAESHVDRSILGPDDFLKTNIMGTFNLLQVAKEFWVKEDGSFPNNVIFHHISTDEVYGSLDNNVFAEENSPYNPASPYSASKGSSDLIVLSYYYTYGMPVTLSACTNNYGPYQFPEKFLPLMIYNLKNNKDVPIYGKGDNIRDWIYVQDHNAAVWLIVNKGIAGEKYNIGGENLITNINLVYKTIDCVANEMGKSCDDLKKLITFVKDRPGHDKRYGLNCAKIKNTLKWERKMPFEKGLEKTIKWYFNNDIWVNNVISGSYKNWINKNYINRDKV